MAALVQKTAQFFFDGVTGASRSITGVTAGNTLVATVALCSQPNTSPTPAIPTPSGWAVAIAPVGTTGIDAYRPACAIFYKADAAAGSHTISWADGSFPTDTYGEVTIEEFSGLDTSAPLDQASSATATGATSGNAGTPSASSSLGGVNVAVGSTGGGGSSFLSPPNSGYTAIDTEPDPNTHMTYGSAYKIQGASAVVHSAAWTWSGSASFVGVQASFKNASGGGGDHPIDGAGQIASGEASGAPSIAATVAPAGIASAEAIGSASVGAGIVAVGIASAQALGAPAVGAAIVAAGIASAEAVGAPVVNGAGIIAAGIPSAEAFGQPAVGAGIVAAGVASGEAVGQPTVGTGTQATSGGGGIDPGPAWHYRRGKRKKRERDWLDGPEEVAEEPAAPPAPITQVRAAIDEAVAAARMRSLRAQEVMLIEHAEQRAAAARALAELEEEEEVAALLLLL